MSKLLRTLLLFLLAVPCYAQTADTASVRKVRRESDSLSAQLPAISQLCATKLPGYARNTMCPALLRLIPALDTNSKALVVPVVSVPPAPAPAPTPAPVPVDTVKPAPVPAPAPVPVDTGIASKIRAALGPIAAGPAWYEDSLRIEANAQWAAFGAQWDAGNSISAYERPALFYGRYALTGDTVWSSRAHQLVVNWRDNYLIPAGYGTSPHWSQSESLYLDCLVAKDQKSCDAIPQVASRLSGFVPSGYFYIAQGEPRIQARVMIALWMNEKHSGQHSDALDSAIVKSLRITNADGWAPFVSTCGGSLNYMNGMLYDVLTRIYDQRPGSYNAAIKEKAIAFGDYLWRSQWRSDGSFNYMSLLCMGTGSPTAAPDLNGLMTPLFGWLGKTTGDSTWFARGDSIVAGMQNASVYLYRQYSESFSSSFRYFGYKASR